jgi:hypothetical protein
MMPDHVDEHTAGSSARKTLTEFGTELYASREFYLQGASFEGGPIVRTWTPPTLPGFQHLMACRARLHPYIRTFAAARAAVPDGIGWLASQSLFRTRGAADVLGSSNHGLTWFAITA